MKRVVIEGICESSAAGAVMEGRHWRGVMIFRPWRFSPDGELSKELLRVVLPARRTSGEAWRDGKRGKVGAAYRFTAMLHPARPNLLTSADLVGRLGRVTASEALARGDAEVAATVRVKDPVLGPLVRRPRQQHFEGRVKVSGRNVRLHVDGSVERASALFARVRARLPALPGVVAKKMLRLANRVWLDRPISERELLRRLKPVEVRLDARSLAISFSCGDTFGDHGISATVSGRGAIGRIHLH